MRKLLRSLAAAVVVVACAAQPIAFDACRAACERTVPVAATPPCHHGAALGSQIGQLPRPCGQEHAVVPADSGVSGLPQSITWVVVSPHASPFGALAPSPAIADSAPSPPAISVALESNTPIRV